MTASHVPVRSPLKTAAVIALWALAIAAGASGEAARRMEWPAHRLVVETSHSTGSLYEAAKVGLPAL